MHGEAPTPFDGEEAGLATKTIYAEDDTYICIDAYDILGHPGTLMAVPDNPLYMEFG